MRTGILSQSHLALTRMIQDQIPAAAAAILAGELVGMPTETVYGLAADATSSEAVAKIFNAKQRPAFNPLICHVSDLDMGKNYGFFGTHATALAHAFWPGPLTLVVPRLPDAKISHLITAGLDTIALRAPSHPVARALIHAAARPLAAPSANKSGSISPTRAEDVIKALGADISIVLDGGATSIGLESTIVKCSGDDLTLLRPGGVSRSDLEMVAGRPVHAPLTPKIEGPGMLESHYAPRTVLVKDIHHPGDGDAYLAFGPDNIAHANMLNLSANGDLDEAASNLFYFMRQLDDLCIRNNLGRIAVAPIPNQAIGEAINDRLARAAADRRGRV